MWLYFNEKGQILEVLEHGAPPRTGTTEFEIFAFFENTDIDVSYSNAALKLKKPDIEEEEYPLLLMDKVEKTFYPYEDENHDFFEDGKTYKGYYFDFGDFNYYQTVQGLLDTPGMWRAIVVLFGADRTINVQGAASFYVARGSLSDATQISTDTLLNQIFLAMATKLDANSPRYLRVVSDISNFAETGFPDTEFNVGDVLFDKSDGSFYKLNSLEYEEGVNPERFTFTINSLALEELNLPDAGSIKFANGENLQSVLDYKYVTVEEQDYTIAEEDK